MLKYFPLWPDQASTFAGNVDALYAFLVLMSAVLFVLISATAITFSVVYRRRPGVEATPIEGSTILELTWSVIPFLVMMVIFVWGAVIFFEERTPPRDAVELYAVAKQWMWKFEHPEGQREINELHVPMGRNIKIIMTSQDVIHSLYLPAMRIKQDVLPGRYTTLWFNATKAGEYHLFCAEYCGTQHSLMGGKIVVMQPADYEAWLNGGSGRTSLVATGQKLFTELGCATCHRSEGQGRGPMLAGIFGNKQLLQDGRLIKVDEDYIRESILNPQAKIVSGFQPIMPTFQGQVSEEQLVSLVAYVKSLKAADGTAAATATAQVQPRQVK